ncbi:hypothetical protein SAMN04515656_12923 [Eubacterium aggregans]|uniref:Uncharacterized protein n=1 Tax=Eubacterium aggregans TaxID=81409 RepID=A0A1H4DYR2_9FIRM|nr:HNH endonuclease [Eubacterium aggregans]SEA77648.1 hypothetical protein SAMN04515656_12923 [Eubacterium aggregans]
MNKPKAKIIEDIARSLINNNKQEAIDWIEQEYPFKRIKKSRRTYSDEQMCEVFMRDGFIDRYSGDRLVNIGMLKTISVFFSEEFPYQSHWKMTETHPAFWELAPTLDHVDPIAMGGLDEPSNWVTTSMMHNMVKSQWTLEQLNWQLHEPGDLLEWDGLTGYFLKIVVENEELLEDGLIKKWYLLSKAILNL